MSNPKQTGTWDQLATDLFGGVDADFLSSFRAPGGANKRLAAWDPFDTTARYFKFLLFNLARNQPAAFFNCHAELGNTELGSPTSVKVAGQLINMDYLLSVEEFLFLKAALPVNKLDSVVEIGAGFGRTCHTLIALLTRLERYTIVDIKDVLNLSRSYLKQVLDDDQFAKIVFIDKDNEGQWSGLKSDLVININSFQEMPEAVIAAYEAGIIANAKYAYIKNPICKYHPSSIGLPVEDIDKSLDVFALGRCKDIVDIFDEDALIEARKNYLRVYSPGLGWKVIAEQPLGAFPYLHNALFGRDTG